MEITLHQKRVVDYMREHGYITQKQAMDELGESRLSARIFELKKQGYIIMGEYFTVKNRYGENTRVKRYILIE